MGDILRDVSWRGTFEMGCDCKGRILCAISYGVLSAKTITQLDEAINDEREVLWAIFENYKFVKFVRWPPIPMEEHTHHGTKARRIKPIQVGDFGRLVSAVNSKAIDLAQLENEFTEKAETPSHVDPGLTAAYLLSKGLRPTAGRANRVQTNKINAELKSQFNASLLTIGMTQSKVETVLHAKPLKSGHVASGYVHVYGSNRSVEIAFPVRYSNILVLYKNGKVIGLYSGETIPGGDDWEHAIQEHFSDLSKGGIQ